MKDKTAEPAKISDAGKTPQQLEWKKRLELSLLLVMVFALLSIIGSLFYRYTGVNYTAKDAYRDLGFYDANASQNVNAAVVNGNANVDVSGAVNANSNTNAATNVNGGN